MSYILIAIALAALRIAGHKSEAFQAVAHLFVGWLLAGWYFNSAWGSRDGMAEDRSGLYLGLAIVLSIIEVACALWFKFSEVM